MPIRPVATPVKDLFEDAPETMLTDDASSGADTLSVESIRDLAINKILFIGELGEETSEIIKTHAATAPTGTTVTLASNLVFNHLNGTKIYVIDYDQIEFSHAATTTGAKTVISTDDIDPDSVETVLKDSTYSDGYYFIRFKNSIDGSFSSYSDPIPYEGWSENQVAKIIEYAMKRNKLVNYTDNVSYDFCLQEINSCLKYVHGKLKKWHALQNFDYVIGETERGIYSFDMPTDSWKQSNKSVLGFRIGTDINLIYKDKTEWEEYLEGVKHGVLSADASAGDTTLTLDNSRDLSDEGTVMIKGQEITYTANDKDTGILSGIPASGDGAITADLDADDDVWQGSYEEGDPEIFTVYNERVYFWPLCDTQHSNLNAYMDYWKEAPSVDSDADEIDILRYDMVKFWLVWAIRGQIKNDGMRSIDDGDFRMFSDILTDAIKKELQTSGQKRKTQPLMNKIRF